VYEVSFEKITPRDKHPAECQVCGKQMMCPNGSTIPHFELIQMPDGTNV
jgi:hypothetical protein